MTSGLNYSSIKIAHQVREFEEKRSQERRKSLLCLIHHYLLDEGYHQTAETFENEAQITKQLIVCDNVDLSTILQEYETYYFLRFQKYPKICKKVQALPASSPVVEGKIKIPRKSFESAVAGDDAPTTKVNPTNISRQNLRPNQSLRCNSLSRATNLVRAKSNASTFNLDISVSPLTAAVDCLNARQDNDELSDFSADRPLRSLSSCVSNLGSEWKDYADIISKEIFVQNTNVGWEDVKGLETAKMLLKEAVVYPSKYPELFKNILTPWKGLLLFGPPGTGKTLLAKSVATESQSTFFNISASSLVSKWRGDSEKLVRVLFEVARQHAPSTIFVDELDALASRRDGPIEHEASRRLKSELLIQLDGLAQSNDRVFLLATSNLPWDLDPAMLRRLEKRILVDLPSLEARISMLRHHLPPKIIEKPNPELTCELDYEQLAQEMSGYSGSDIKLVCKEAAMGAMRKALAALETVEKSSDLESLNLDVVTNADVMKAIERTRPSPSGLLDRYRNWQLEFGSF